MLLQLLGLLVSALSITTLPSNVVVWIITPTHRDPRRYADLAGIAAGFHEHRENIVWVLIEDAKEKDEAFEKFIAKENIPYVYLAVPNQFPVCKGLTARNLGLQYALKNADADNRNFFIMADDDNRFSSRLLPALVAQTTKVAAWPVGNIGYGISTPLLDSSGEVYDFFDHYRRRWSLDMAGFGGSIDWMLATKGTDHWRLNRCTAGQQETMWVERFGLKPRDFVCLEKCSDILAYHTKTMKYPKWPIKPNTWAQVYSSATNLRALVESYVEYDIELPEV
ncbi:MAG: uncharacterized protein KVP18_001546 [Porospora cf. gigantea A]|uniref:uncharacterized protein n=1 Tax=Porospora cf. gigantea A TaxID=2853593 RepID=UPI00355971E8|nr:MAG: hypothetical protein KVP18_001546 [Porospora cf. gigantea A]